jgi:hypothetical protein
MKGTGAVSAFIRAVCIVQCAVCTAHCAVHCAVCSAVCTVQFSIRQEITLEFRLVQVYIYSKLPQAIEYFQHNIAVVLKMKVKLFKEQKILMFCRLEKI